MTVPVDRLPVVLVPYDEKGTVSRDRRVQVTGDTGSVPGYRFSIGHWHCNIRHSLSQFTLRVGRNTLFLGILRRASAVEQYVVLCQFYNLHFATCYFRHRVSQSSRGDHQIIRTTIRVSLTLPQWGLIW